MKRLALLLVLVCVGPVSSFSAEKLGDRLGKALDRFGEKFSKGIEKGIETLTDKADRTGRVSAGTPQTGLCSRHDGTGDLVDAFDCASTTDCDVKKHCETRFESSTRPIYVVTHVDGRNIALNGRPAKAGSYQNKECFQDRENRSLFCFVEGSGTARNLPSEKPENGSGSSAGTDSPVTTPAPSPGSTTSDQAEAWSTVTVEDLLAEGKIAVTRHYSGNTYATLSPIDAMTPCRKETPEDFGIDIHAGWTAETIRELQKHCLAEAARYIQRESFGLIDVEAEKVLSAQATIDGLRTHRWYALDLTVLNKIPADFRKASTDHYVDRIRGKYDVAVTAAVSEIKKAFGSAAPFSPSEARARALCAGVDGGPTEIVDVCQREVLAFAERKDKESCQRAIAASVVPDDVFDSDFVINARPRQTIRFRELACEIGRKTPGMAIAYRNSWFWIFGRPQLDIVDPDGKVAATVTLRTTSILDGRALSEILLDIATGRNDRSVPLTYHANGIVAARSGLERISNATIIVRCAAHFDYCE